MSLLFPKCPQIFTSYETFVSNFFQPHQNTGLSLYKPFPTQQILDSSKRKEFADDNFKFDENGRKFSKWVKNTVGKGEIAR